MTESLVHQAAQLPVVGKWVSRIGKVVNITATPCAFQPEIWVEAAWANLPHLLFGFIKPFRIAQSFYAHAPGEPKFGLGHKQSGGKKRGKTTYRAHLDGMLRATNPIEAAPGWARFAPLAELALKIDWYFFLADLTTDFLVNWVSLAYQWSGCQQPGEPWAQGHAIQSLTVGTNAGTFLFDEWQPDRVDGAFMDSTFILFPSGWDGSCGFTLTTGPFPGHPELKQCTWSASLKDLIRDITYPPVEANKWTGGLGASYFHQGNIELANGNRYCVEVTKSDGVFYCTGGNFTGSAAKLNPRELLPDP